MSWWLVILAWWVVSIPVSLALGRLFRANAERSAVTHIETPEPLRVVRVNGDAQVVRVRQRERYVAASRAPKRAKPESA